MHHEFLTWNILGIHPQDNVIGRTRCTFCPENTLFEILMILYVNFYLGKVIGCIKNYLLGIFYLELFT